MTSLPLALLIRKTFTFEGPIKRARTFEVPISFHNFHIPYECPFGRFTKNIV